MKLWELRFRHYAPKDSEEGIIGYLIADSSEQIYNFIKTEPSLKDGSKYGKGLYVSWGDLDNTENEEYDEGHRQRLIDCCGEMYDEEEEVNDAFYGVTHYGWVCVRNEISNLEIATLQSCGLIVVDIPRELKKLREETK